MSNTVPPIINPSKKCTAEKKIQKVEDNKFERSQASKLKNMIAKELELAHNSLLEHLFKRAGYDYNPTTFSITAQPSKFGGQWKEGVVGEVNEEKENEKSSEEFCQSSLLENNKLIELINQPLCDICGSL